MCSLAILEGLHCINKGELGQNNPFVVILFLEINDSISPPLVPGVPYNVSVHAMNGAPQFGVVTVIIAYVAPRRKFSSSYCICNNERKITFLQ